MLIVGLLALAAAGCEDRRKKAIEKVDHDQEILRKAGAAVNEVIRNAPDCEVAKPLLTEAYQRIDDARRQVTVPASQETLDALKVQVDRVAQVCP
jgi:nitrogenase subunit NifH